MNSNNQTANLHASRKNLVMPAYGIGTCLNQIPLVNGSPILRGWFLEDTAEIEQQRRAEILSLQAAAKKWHIWQRGGRGLSDAEIDACKSLSNMSPEDRQRVLSLRLPDA